MARGSLEQFSAAKGRVTGAPEVYVVQRMNPFAMLPEASPVLDLVFGRPSSTRTASRSGGLIMMNDTLLRQLERSSVLIPREPRRVSSLSIP